MSLANDLILLCMALGFGGVLASFSYSVYLLIEEYVHRTLIVSLQIDNIDPVYKWVLQFLTHKDYLSLSESIVKLVKK